MSNCYCVCVCVCAHVCHIQEMTAHYNDTMYGVSSYRILISYRLGEQGKLGVCRLGF